jgi:hypothetical protein
VVSNSTPTTLGSSVTFTATVTGPSGGATPSGTLTWTLTGPVTTCTSTTGPTGSANLVTYTCVITASKAGTYSAKAAYPGDSNYNSVTSSADSVTVAKASPTNVVSNSTPTTLGSSVTFTATVSGPSGGATPSGTLTWTLTGPVTTCTSTTGPTGSANVATYTCVITASKAGTYSAKAAYPGDSNYNSVTSSPDSFMVPMASPINVVSNSPTSPTLGSKVTFTATVTGPSGGATPSGTLTWTLTGPVTACTSTTGPTGASNLAAYTCVITASKAGTYSATAAYPGDSNYNSVTSSPDSFTVAVASPTNGVTNSPTSPTLGSKVTFTATVTGPSGGATPSGTLTWTLTGPVTTCTSTTGPTGASNLATYTCVITASTAATYSATAAYPGDSNYNSVTSSPDSFTVPMASPTNVVTNSPTIPTLGNSVTFTAKVTGPSGGATPSGTLTWTLTGPVTTCTSTTGPTGASNLATYTCVITASKPGTYSATAAYPGDSNYNSVTSSPDSFTVAMASPSVAVTNLPTSPTLGSSVTFTARVTGPSGGATPSGTLTWTLTGPVTTCTSTTGPTGASNVVTYTCVITASTAGTYSATAAYPGDSNYNSVTSSADSFTVATVSPTNVVSKSTPTTLGSSVTFTATVTGPSGGPTPSGPVTWSVSGTAGASACTSSTTTLSGSGNTATATCTITVATAGTYAVSDSYGGDSNYNSVISSANSITVAKASPTNVVSNSTPTTLGSSVTFTATVTGPSGGATPSGTLTWTLTGPVTTCTSTTGPTGSANVATYTCVITASKAGTYSAKAIYSADSNYNSVTSSVDSFTVGKASPANVVSNSTPTLGSSVTFTATVTGPSGGATPSGTLTWTLTGPVTTCTSTTGPTGASSLATYTCVITASKAGTYSAKAAYPGDSNYNSVTSSPDSFTVPMASPSVDVTNNSVLTGGTLTFTATVTGPSGAATPAGSLTWTVTPLGGGSVPCSSTTGPTGASNVATYTCSVTGAVAGTYSATAAYPGDSNYNSALGSDTTASVVAQTIVQDSPTSDSTSTTSTSTYTNQLTPASGYLGPVAWSQTTGSADLEVSSSGVVTTTGFLAAGTYTATGTTSDGYGASGTFTFTLTVVAQTIVQGSPTSDSTSTTSSNTYTNQLNPASGYVGPVAWSQSTGSADLQVSSSGVVTTTGFLAAGTYTATGTTSDGYGASGTFTFTLTVVAQTIVQGSPTSDSTSTTSSSTYTNQLSPASGYVGPVAWSQSTGSADLQVSSSGVVTTTGFLTAGTYTATGTTSDGYGDSGTWSLTLTVRAGTITQSDPPTGDGYRDTGPWSFTSTVKAGTITRGDPPTGAALPEMLSKLLLAAGILLVLAGTLLSRRGQRSRAGRPPTLSS